MSAYAQVALLGCLALFRSDSIAESDLGAIVGNVKANEAMYRNIEIERVIKYHAPPGPDQADVAYREKTEEVRFVRQGGFCYSSSKEKGRTQEGTEHSRQELVGYDGEVRRSVFDTSVVNLEDEPPENMPSRYSPHTLLFYWNRMFFPLSVYLKEEPAYPNTEHTVSYEGVETVDGLVCLKLRCEDLAGAKNARNGGRVIIWLARDRNYLPIRYERYESDSVPPWPKLPRSVGRVTELQKISPDVWYPMKATLVVYTERDIAKGRHVVGYSTEFETTKVSLDPHYYISLFRDIKIPDGATVYRIKNGKVIESYRQGGGKEEKAKMSPRTPGSR
jgi:hypothetical protein